MVNEFKALQEMDKKIPNIIEEIEKVCKEYEANTFTTTMTFLHKLFDHFVDSEHLVREEAYKDFAFVDIEVNREVKKN